MRIWHKILVAPVVAIAFMLALGAVSWQMLTRQNAALEDLARTRMAASQVAAEAAGDLSEVHSNVYRLFTWIASLGDNRVKAITEEQRKYIAGIHDHLAKLAANPALSAEERKLVNDTLPKLAKYRKLMDDAIDMSTVDVGTGAMAMQNADQQYQEVLKEMDRLVQLEKKLGQESYEAAAAASRTALMVVLAILAIAVVASLVIALAMSAAIVRPLKAAIAVAGRIAKGELGTEVQVRGSDETADLLHALAEMAQNLRQLVSEVSAGAHMVADTSAQIAQGNQDLSQRTEEQASTLEETASSMEELTATVTQNAENARVASQLAVDASEVARKGGQVVGQVVSTMTGISESSRKIADIIGVIDGIAFQTNILALNAAVEAARAGEQGRGFAVVAAEVRNLAHRSAQAAKEIKSLIGESIGSAQAGQQLADAAEATMARVVESVAQVTQVLGAIAHASREQSAGVQEVSQAIAQIDAATQQNAALVEEAAGAAESFQHEARQLVDVVGRFKTDRNDDRGRVIALVKDAVEHVRRHGVKRACDDLNDPQGEFVRGEDYVFALAADGTQLAFAPDRNIVGRNNVDESDPTGKVVGREILRVAADPGFGWVDYHFRHPTTGEIVPKSVYVEAVEGIILGCGIYGRAPAPAAAASAPVAGRLGGGTFGPARMHEEGLRKAASRVPLALTRAAPP